MNARIFVVVLAGLATHVILAESLFDAINQRLQKAKVKCKVADCREMVLEEDLVCHSHRAFRPCTGGCGEYRYMGQICDKCDQKRRERSLLNAQPKAQSTIRRTDNIRTNKGTVVSANNDSTLFGDFRFGMLGAPQDSDKGVSRRLSEKYLKIFDRADLYFGKKSLALTKVTFRSVALHVECKDDFVLYETSVLEDLKARYGFEMVKRRDSSRDPNRYECRTEKFNVSMYWGNGECKSGGNTDSYWFVLLSVTSLSDEQFEKEFSWRNMGEDLWIVPDGHSDSKFWHRKYGFSFTVSKDGKYRVTGISGNLVKNNNYVVKIPSSITFGSRLESRGTYRIDNPVAAGDAVDRGWKGQSRVISLDLSECNCGKKMVSLSEKRWKSIKDVRFPESLIAEIEKEKRDEEERKRQVDEAIKQEIMAEESRVNKLYQAALAEGKDAEVQAKEKEWKSKTVAEKERPISFFGIPFDIPIEVNPNAPVALPLSSIKLIEPLEESASKGIYRIYPVTPWRRFNEYSLQVTPITHKVVGVKFRLKDSKKYGIKIGDSEFKDVKQLLAAKYGISAVDPRTRNSQKPLTMRELDNVPSDFVPFVLAVEKHNRELEKWASRARIRFNDGSYIDIDYELMNPFKLEAGMDAESRELTVSFVNKKMEECYNDECEQIKRKGMLESHQQDVDAL